MEDIIHVELRDLGDHLRSVEGRELETNQLFNFYVMNSLWSMMCGSRLDVGLKWPQEILTGVSEKFNKTRDIVLNVTGRSAVRS